jgi:hypothetical protein
MVGYARCSPCVIHKEGLCSSSGDINRLMMMYLLFQPLLKYGSVAAGVCSAILGTQIHINWGPNWLTALVIYLFTIMYILGAGTVPYVLVGEVFVPEVRFRVALLTVVFDHQYNIDGYNVKGLKGHFGKNYFLLNSRFIELFLMAYQRLFYPL